MAVLPELHRQGIGRALLGHAEAMLAADGVEFLQVKTLGPSKSDDGYDKTRAFYLAYGFRPLEEFPELWGPREPSSADDQGGPHSEGVVAARGPAMYGGRSSLAYFEVGRSISLSSKAYRTASRRCPSNSLYDLRRAS
jgi:ribosomal protein S18 acetylase RimI-like enzyme